MTKRTTLKHPITAEMQVEKLRPEFKPWEYSTAWKTESQFWSWVRGQMRRMWKDNPVRIDFKKAALRPVSPEEKTKKVFHPSTKNVGQCYLCGEWFAGSKLEVDHLNPAGSCKDYQTSLSFFDAQVFCPPSNMDLVCKTCHPIKTYADKNNLEFHEAKLEKKAIAFGKLPKSTQETFFKERGVTPPTNSKTRRERYKELISNE